MVGSSATMDPIGSPHPARIPPLPIPRTWIQCMVLVAAMGDGDGGGDDNKDESRAQELLGF